MFSFLCALFSQFRKLVWIALDTLTFPTKLMLHFAAPLQQSILDLLRRSDDNLRPGFSRLKPLPNLGLLNNARLTHFLDKWPKKYGDVVSVLVDQERCVLLNSSNAVQQAIDDRYNVKNNWGCAGVELVWPSELLRNDGALWIRNQKLTFRLLRKYCMYPRQVHIDMWFELNHLFCIWDQLEVS